MMAWDQAGTRSAVGPNSRLYNGKTVILHDRAANCFADHLRRREHPLGILDFSRAGPGRRVPRGKELAAVLVGDDRDWKAPETHGLRRDLFLVHPYQRTHDRQRRRR